MTPRTVACRDPWDLLCKDTGEGYHFFLQGIFPTQELNSGLLHYRQILYHLSYTGSPMGSSQPRDQTQVSHIAGRFFISEPQGKPKKTGAGSLSLLQQIFPTQESNLGLLHCRLILFRLSYEGSSCHMYFNYYWCFLFLNVMFSIPGSTHNIFVLPSHIFLYLQSFFKSNSVFFKKNIY